MDSWVSLGIAVVSFVAACASLVSNIRMRRELLNARDRAAVLGERADQYERENFRLRLADSQRKQSRILAAKRAALTRAERKAARQAEPEPDPPSRRYVDLG